MNREEALELVKSKVKNENLVNHMLAVEAVMRRLAERLGGDPDKWGMAGLLHDVDYSETGEDPTRHGEVGARMLEEMGVEPEIVNAVRAHNVALGYPRNTLMEKAIYAADPVTGLVVAAALVQPDKKIASVKLKSLKKKYKDKSFARGANREQIASCSELGIDLGDFLSLALEAMGKIADAIGL